MKKTILSICIFLFGLFLIANISAITIKDVSSSPTEVAPGEVVSVSVEIENIFNYDIEDIRIKLDLEEVPFAPYQSSSEKYLDELDEDDDEKFTFKLISLPETTSGIYKIPIEINYKDDEGEENTKESLISVTVNSKPELKVFLEDSVVLIKGKENEIVIKIVNSGLSDVKFVYLQASDVSGVKFLTDKEQYIGDIDSDDFDSVKYNIYIETDGSNSINLPVILRYKDATNKEYIETRQVDLKTYSLKEAQGLGLAKKPNYTIPVIIVLIVLGYFIRRKLKKRKLKKKIK